jgi:putative copper resistance protein D
LWTTLVICRFVHFAAMMLLFGALAVRSVLTFDRSTLSIDGWFWTLLRITALAAALTAILWLLLVSVEFTDTWATVVDPSIIKSVLVDTNFGHLWRWRLLSAVLLACTVWTNWRGRQGLGLALAALCLGSLGLTGHAAGDESSLGVLHRYNNVVHLLASGAWVGGLVPVALLFWIQSAGVEVDIIEALRRFSIVGQIAVVVVLLTGVGNTLFIVSWVPEAYFSPYGRVLAAKVCLVGTMIGLALFNRYMLLSRVQDGSEVALGRMKRNVVLEISIGAAVIGAASVLGTLIPAGQGGEF